MKKDMSSKLLSKLYHKLDVRFEALRDDLLIISDSKKLEAWRWKNQRLLQYVFQSAFQLKSFSATLYTDPIRYEWRKKERVFWLEKKDEYADNYQKHTKYWKFITNPSFSLRKIRSYIKDKEVLSVLREAVEKELIPRDKNNALTLEQIKKKILCFSSHKQAKTDEEILQSNRVKPLEEIVKKKKSMA